MKHCLRLLAFAARLVCHARRLLMSGGVARRQAAQGLVEYAIILVLVAIVVAGAVTTTGRRVSSTYEEINCTLARENGEGTANNGAKRQCSTNPGNGRGG